MNLELFKGSPWARSHRAYRGATLSMNPAPENATSEVLIASLYRTVGTFSASGTGTISEGQVPQLGKNLEKTIATARDRKPEGAALDSEGVHVLLHNVLDSPKSSAQATKRFLQVTPLVGETASFSGSARRVGNPWPAGSLVRQMVWQGSLNDAAAREIWLRLADALKVQDDDDVFAHFLRDEIAAWSGKPWAGVPTFPGPDECRCLPEGELDGLAWPARQFCADLEAVLAAKSVMTRRQWMSLLEALVRIAAVAHVAWVCEVHRRLWDCVRRVLAGGDLPDDTRTAIYPQALAYLTYGIKAESELKDRTSSYLSARLGLNAVLWALDDCDRPFEEQLSSAGDVARLLKLIKANSEVLSPVLEIVAELMDREVRTLHCQKGVGSNVLEFSRYVLGQRMPANERLRGHDQGYVLRKRTVAKSSPWICAPGPVALLLLVHCSLARLAGPRSVHRLAQHMAEYGIIVDHKKIASNELGVQLRTLGLVLDSPDAESGMLLMSPFPHARVQRTGS
jgi:hypothetical protein